MDRREKTRAFVKIFLHPETGCRFITELLVVLTIAFFAQDLFTWLLSLPNPQSTLLGFTLLLPSYFVGCPIGHFGYEIFIGPKLRAKGRDENSLWQGLKLFLVLAIFFWIIPLFIGAIVYLKFFQ